MKTYQLGIHQKWRICQVCLKDADSFNQSLNNWDVSKVKTMKNMFRGAISFNQPLNKWNVGEVMDMEEMFEADLQIQSKY